jgi:hypothetical protein
MSYVASLWSWRLHNEYSTKWGPTAKWLTRMTDKILRGKSSSKARPLLFWRNIRTCGILKETQNRTAEEWRWFRNVVFYAEIKLVPIWCTQNNCWGYVTWDGDVDRYVIVRKLLFTAGTKSRNRRYLWRLRLYVRKVDYSSNDVFSEISLNTKTLQDLTSRLEVL